MEAMKDTLFEVHNKIQVFKTIFAFKNLIRV